MAGIHRHLPLKLNTSGVIPPIFASSLLLIPATIIGFGVNSSHMPDWFAGFIAIAATWPAALFGTLCFADCVFLVFLYSDCL